MPTLLNLAGDEDFYFGEPRRSNKVDAGIFLSLAPCMEMLCSPRKKPRCNSTLSLGEAKLQRDAKDLINMLPDECLYEIFRCLPRAQDRSACAGVSKRWLMLQSSMRRSDFKHRSKPSSKTSGERPCGGRSVNTAQSAGATFLEQETYESSSEAAGEGTDIDVGGKRSFEEGKSEKQQPRWTIGYLSRCLEGKKATDVKLAAIAVGTGGCGSLGKLLIRGSASSRGVSDMGLSTIGLGCPALGVLSLWDCPLVSDKGLAAIAKGCRLLEKLDLCSRCPGIGDEGLEAIAQNCPNLLTLNIESCPRVGNNSLKAIGRYCPKLELLSVNDCAHVSDEGIITVVSNLTKLMKLKLQAVKVTNMTLVAIGHYGNSLTDLSLESLHRVTEKGFWSMGRALGLQKLKVLVVTFCPGFTDLGFEAVGQGCLSLKRVSIRKCKSLTDNGLKAFTQVTTSLENLRIEECHSISSIGLREMLASCSGRLKVLSLIKCEGIRESALTTMPLPVCESLKTLNIRHCSGVGNGCLALLGRACPQLQYLDLSGLTGICDSGLLALLESNKTSMMKVNLSGCVQVTDWAVFAIANLCGKNLQTLSLDGCRKVTDRSLKVIADLCPVLQDFDLAKCDIWCIWGVNKTFSKCQRTWNCWVCTWSWASFLGCYCSASQWGLGLCFLDCGRYQCKLHKMF